ncbi:hypothetical protein GCM10022204_27990 [Microlunatus aurantiacus]|uniref:MftR C-terminal domain-containing protein n=1 Tax=Microlunatus aurantiacus TaxID=446786 RepID=A0ABP7DQ40_9ACTN
MHDLLQALSLAPRILAYRVQLGLTAHLAVSVFRTAFVRWIAAGEVQSMRALERDVLETLQALTSS